VCEWYTVLPSSHLSFLTHTHTPVLWPVTGRRSTRKAKPIWISLKQETVSGSGISWAICKSAPCCRQITTPAHTQPRMDVDPTRVELPSAGGGISSCRPWGHNLLTMTSVNLYVLLRCVHKEIRQLTVYCRDCWKEYSCSE